MISNILYRCTRGRICSLLIRHFESLHLLGDHITKYPLHVSEGLGRVFFFSSRRRHTRYWRDWSSDVCSSDLARTCPTATRPARGPCSSPARRLGGAHSTSSRGVTVPLCGVTAGIASGPSPAATACAARIVSPWVTSATTSAGGSAHRTFRYADRKSTRL